MGLLIVCKGADFSACAVDKVELPEVECDHAYVDGYCTLCGKRDPDNPYTLAEYPVPATLKGLYDLGGTAEATLVNHAPEPHANTADEVLDGDYEMADNYVAFSGIANKCRMSTYLQPSLANKVTFVALFSVNSGQNPSNRVIIGNRGSNSSNLGLGMLNDCMRFGNGGVIAERQYPTPVSSDKFAILAMTADENGCRVVRYTNGTLATLSEYTGTVDGWSTAKIQIGGDSTSNNYGTARISLAAIHEGAMTDEQLTDICAFVKAYGEQKGLVIE